MRASAKLHAVVRPIGVSRIPQKILNGKFIGGKGLLNVIRLLDVVIILLDVIYIHTHTHTHTHTSMGTPTLITLTGSG
jgi:hypothetical protein